MTFKSVILSGAPPNLNRSDTQWRVVEGSRRWISIDYRFREFYRYKFLVRTSFRGVVA